METIGRFRVYEFSRASISGQGRPEANKSTKLLADSLKQLALGFRA